MLKALFTRYLIYRYKYTKVKCVSDECVICTDPIENEYVPRFACKHKFHTKCIEKWLKINDLCPICRADLSVIHLQTLYEI